MLIFRTLHEFRAWRAAFRGGDLGFVPTMGALHAGHRALIERSAGGNPATAVSIFVNPLQFGPGEDFAKYPRTLDADLELCRNAGVTAVLAEPADFYAPGHATYCEVEGLDRFLCGASRPGHFRGVCTVVLKLFHLARPARAYFGQKDLQQALILRKMVSDLAVDLDLVVVPTVREPSGLALSSRNAYLSPDEKARATALYRGLGEAHRAWEGGERDAAALKALARAAIQASAPARIDYVEVVSQDRLEPVERVDAPAALAVAAFYGKTRLIDNILLG